VLSDHTNAVWSARADQRSEEPILTVMHFSGGTCKNPRIQTYLFCLNPGGTR
jgi:hypothetical protein